jgi:flagellar motor switch protein FliN
MTDDKTKRPTPSSPADAARAVVAVHPEDAGVVSRGNPSATDLARVLDVTVVLMVQLGSRRMRVADVLALAPGSTVEFMKPADESLDIFVNDQLVARGEAVVLGERYGVRITEVVSPNERLRQSGVIREAAR